MERIRKPQVHTSGDKLLIHAACLGEKAVIHSEGMVENLAGNPSLINIGDHSHIRGRLLIYAHDGRITLGSWCYVGVRSEIWSMSEIRIGNRVLISHDVNIHDGTAHSADPKQRHEHFRRMVTDGHPFMAEDLPGVSSSPVIIEDDVWISFGVTILKGVRIGRESIIAAGSIVMQDVPPGVLYRCRVEPEIIKL